MLSRRLVQGDRIQIERGMDDVRSFEDYSILGKTIVGGRQKTSLCARWGRRLEVQRTGFVNYFNGLRFRASSLRLHLIIDTHRTLAECPTFLKHAYESPQNVNHEIEPLNSSDEQSQVPLTGVERTLCGKIGHIAYPSLLQAHAATHSQVVETIELHLRDLGKLVLAQV